MCLYLAHETCQTAPVPPAPAEADALLAARHHLAAAPADRQVVDPAPAAVADHVLAGAGNALGQRPGRDGVALLVSAKGMAA